MPRKLKNPTPLRQVRDALSSIEGRIVSQAMFAKRLGLSASYVNSIEAGAKPMTRELAMRISDMYGASYRSLMPGSKCASFSDTYWESEGQFFDFKPAPELVVGIREHLSCNNFSEINAYAAYDFDRNILRRMQSIFQAALDAKKGSFLQIRMEQAMDDWISEFKLRDALPLGYHIEWAGAPTPTQRPTVSQLPHPYVPVRNRTPGGKPSFMAKHGKPGIEPKQPSKQPSLPQRVPASKTARPRKG